jgi:type VI secretion system VgrG family protein
MSLKQRVEVTFSSEEFTAHYKSDLFNVTGFEGIEVISEPFRFDLDLISDESEIDLTLLVGKTATLEIGRDENVRKVHGVILNMEQGEEVQFNQYSYKAVLVPRLQLLSLSRQNQIYQEKTAPQIVTQEILEGDFSGGIAADDIDSTRLSATYPEREYVVQYKETDLNFISRLMEHEGIYYYFDHSGEREKLVLCDNKSGLDTLLEENTVPYVPASGMAAFEDEAIHSFRLKQTQITSQITLKDFNYRKPNIPLQGDAETCDLGYGRLCDYGDHFKDSMEGDKLAKIRAEVELCKLKTCSGKSDAILFQAGKLFEMQQHFRDDLNGEYLITRIHHKGGQALPGVSGVAVSGEAIAYQNTFDVIPSDVEFRPALKTPKPKLYGILNGTIDGAIFSDRAQIDDQGRYKLIMPFDLSGTAEGKASRWVRKAESYGGQGTGMHFPLLKGTEVIWTCIDGDPDRPIITGVVANPLNKSVVSAANSTDNVIETPSGIILLMKDGKGTTPQDEQGTEQGQTRMASVANTSDIPPANDITAASSAVSKNHLTTTQHAMANEDKTSSLIQQQQHMANFVVQNEVPDDPGTPNDDETQKSYSVHLPSYRKGADGKMQNSYSRIGSFYTEEMDLFDNVYYRPGTFNKDTGRPEGAALSQTLQEASDGQHKIMDVLNATRKTYNIENSTKSASGLYESLNPERFGLMEYTDGAKLMVHWNGCFDLAAGSSLTYDSLGYRDSLISVVMGEDGETPGSGEGDTDYKAGIAEMIKSERFHKIDGDWVTETWEKTKSYTYNNGTQDNIFYGQTYDYCLGKKFEAMTGYSTECTVAGKTSFSAGFETEVKLAYTVSFGAAFEFSCVGGDSTEISDGTKSINANEIMIQHQDSVSSEALSGKTGLAIGVAAGLAGLATGIGLAVAGNEGARDSHGDVASGADGLKIAAITTEALGGVVSAAGAVSYAKQLLAIKSRATAAKALPTPVIPPFINVKKGSITLCAGASKIVLNIDGTIEIEGTDITLSQKVAGVVGSELQLSPVLASMKCGQNGFQSGKLYTAINHGMNTMTSKAAGIEVKGTTIGFS